MSENKKPSAASAETSVLDTSTNKKEKKPKKKHIGLWITLGILFALIVSPIAAFYIAFYDGETTDFVGDNNVSSMQVMERLSVDSLDNTASTTKVEFKLTQDDLDQMLYSAANNMPDEANKYLKKIYVEIIGNEYNFYVDAEVPLFKSRIRLITEFSEEKNGSSQKDDKFLFTIKDAKLGRVGGLLNIVFKYGSSVLSDDVLNNAFASIGLSVKSDLANRRLVYSKSDMLKDIEDKMSVSETNRLYFSILEDFLENNLLSFDFASSAGIYASANMMSLSTNATYCTPDKELGIDVGSYRDKVVTLLNNGVVDTTHIQNSFEYLFHGYDKCSAADREYMVSKDLTSVGISDNVNYKGTDLNYTKQVDEVLKEQITTENIALGEVGKLYEENLNDVLKTTQIMGYTYLLYRQVSDNNYKVNYITIDNFYVNIVNSHMYLVVTANINGYKTSIIFDCERTSCSNYTMNLRTSKVYYGQHAASQVLTTLFYDLVSEAADDEDWIGFNKETGEFSFSFLKAIQDSGHKTEIDAYGTVDANVFGNTINDDGYINITIVPH